MTASIRRDLTLGTVYGLAASTIVWALLLAAPPFDATDALFLALGLAAGAVSTAFPRSWRLVTTYGIAAAAAWVTSPAVSCLAGAASIAAARWCLSSGRRRVRFDRAGLSAGREVLALGLAAVGLEWLRGADTSPFLPLLAHAVIYAAARAGATGMVRVALGGSARPGAVVRHTFAVLPASLIGAAAAWVATVGLVEASVPLLLVPSALVVTWGFGRLQAERRNTIREDTRSTALLRRSVTRALARTMEERDPRTQDHLRRVHRLCIGVAQRFGLSQDEMESLGSAALLHDIGKVAVPESILTKPGRLTPEEFERVKRHSIVGAEIVEALPFRHSLSPIIRHHHERWDGGGYPDRLKGRRIPLGARILSVVDCYDALTMDRPYRQALSHREAVAFMERESERMFDPEIVDALLDYLDAREPAVPAEAVPVAHEPEEPMPDERVVGGTLAAAQRELETLYDVSRAAAYGLNLDEYVTLAGSRLDSLVPFQSLVVYLLDADAGILRSRLAVGRAADKLRLVTIPVGERMSGWAAAHRRPVIGRDHVSPLERDGSRSDLEEWAEDREVAPLRASLAAPMIAQCGLVGVVTLYDAIDRGFTADDRRILMRFAGSLAQVVAEESDSSKVTQTSLTDPLTGVPNARFLWLESAHRMSREGAAFGLVAFRIRGMESLSQSSGNEAVDRALCVIARRFAAGCQRSETLVRFGSDLFVVLVNSHGSGDLIRRWHELLEEVESQPLVEPDGTVRRVQLTAAHAAYPDDGEGLDALLEVLDTRLTVASGRDRTVVPFRTRTAAGAE